ncbi:MAG: vWA domain-containing protein [Flavobacteriales bacterium]
MKTQHLVLSLAFGISLSSFGMYSKHNTSQFPENKYITTVRTAHKPIVSKSKKIQLALLLDTSNSMDGLIHQAKNQLWEMVSQISKESPESSIEIALYHYGNSGLSALTHYVDQRSPFTNNLDKISSELFKLKTNGGEEYCGAVIKMAVNQLDWNEDKTCKKIMVIAGNESFDQGKVSFITSIASALDKDIELNTVFCGDRHSGVIGHWEKAATLSAGEFFVINHNDDVRQIATPYDDAILRCNTAVNQTYVPIFAHQEVEKEDMLANDMEQVVECKERMVEKAIVKKNKNVYNKGSWDAVDQYESNSAGFWSSVNSNGYALNSVFKDKSENEIKLKLKTFKALVILCIPKLRT